MIQCDFVNVYKIKKEVKLIDIAIPGDCRVKENKKKLKNMNN